jgi:Domain of unknown function (DUF1905)/Bacteriocin-protection, YdeI or OmpD-Associated
MVAFPAKIQRFKKNGEKTGWSYIVISRKFAEQMNPGVKVSFRIKGLIDQHPISKTAILPMGEGTFILPLAGPIRKAIGKGEGDTVKVQFDLDERAFTPSSTFIKCLKDEPRALDFFKTLPKSHQNYFSKWIESAKTTGTKTKRITMAVIALGSGQGFNEMMRANKKSNW